MYILSTASIKFKNTYFRTVTLPFIAWIVKTTIDQASQWRTVKRKKNKCQNNNVLVNPKLVISIKRMRLTLPVQVFRWPRNTRLQFSVPGLRGIHRNLKQKKNFNSCEGFFRKSPFCTFYYLNPGFGGPWGMLWIFFLIAIFITLQKNAFGQKKFQISCTGSKEPLWQNWKIANCFRFLWIPRRPGTLN